MIHGEHYFARISSETAQAASACTPWSRRVATEVIDFLARFVGSEIVITQSAKDSLLNFDILPMDVLSILENGAVWGPPENTTRKDFHKYTIVGYCMSEVQRRYAVKVVPDHNHTSISIVAINLLD